MRATKTLKAIKKNKALMLMLSIGLIYMFIFKYGPMVGNILAFKDYSPKLGMFGSEWIGFKYFKQLFNAPNFFQAVRNTLTINALSLIIAFPSSIILASLFNEVKFKRLKATFQSVSYLPYFLSVVIVIGIVLNFVSPSNGLFNIFRTEVLGKKAIHFLGESKYYYPIYVGSGMWQRVGWNSIIYLAAMSTIDVQLYEAAEIDGANRWQKYWNVTFPSILPVISITLVIVIGNMLKIGADKTLLLYNPATYDVADILPSLVYRQGIQSGNFSYATAVGLFESVTNTILILSSNFILKRLTGSGLW